MRVIDIHLAEMAGWRALLTKAQFVANLEINTMLEEYVVQLVFRETRAPLQVRISDHRPSTRGGQYYAPASDGRAAQFTHIVDPRRVDDLADLSAIGDHCLLCAGLFPERLIGGNVPITSFVTLGQAAYRKFSHHAREPIFAMLAEYFVDVMDVLQTVRELEFENACIDPLNAYQLWRDTGSAHAWQVLRRVSAALPGADQTAALH